MRIAIDIDDTVCKTGRKWKRVAERFARLYKLQDYFPNLYDQTKRYLMGDKHKEMFYEAIRAQINILKLKPIRAAIRITKKLQHEGHEVIFVTGRNSDIWGDIEDKTGRWIYKQGINKIIIYINAKDKIGYCINDKVDIIIDNSRRVIAKAETTKQIIAMPSLHGIWYTGYFSDDDQAGDVRVSPHKTWRSVYRHIKRIIRSQHDRVAVQ
jgi:uncharacterized HAD superfamily protein